MVAQMPPALSRRSLLAALSGALGLAVPAAAAREPSPAGRDERLELQATFVAGTAYYEADRVRGSLRPGDALVLRREPDNAHDDLAIEVLTAAGAKLGYLPRACNEPFARLMDAGKTVEAEVIDLNPGQFDDIWMVLTLRIA